MTNGKSNKPEITKLEAFAENAEKQLDKAIGIPGFKITRETLQNLEWKYDDTPHKKTIHRLMDALPSFACFMMT